MSDENSTYRYPCEDLDNNLYLNSQTEVTVITNSSRPYNKSFTAPPETESFFYVSAEDFMLVQREKDEYRRALALINAWRTEEKVYNSRLDKILENVGQDVEMGRTVASILRSFQKEI